MKSFRDYLELSNSCSYDVDDVIGRADRFGVQNFCSPVPSYECFHCSKRISFMIFVSLSLQKFSGTNCPELYPTH